MSTAKANQNAMDTPVSQDNNQMCTEALKSDLLQLGKEARSAAHALAMASTETKNKILCDAADGLVAQTNTILEANAHDIEDAKQANKPESYIDRLTLSPSRISDISQSLRDIAALPDPVGKVLYKDTRPNGLELERVSTPLGVIGVIFESRPNVVMDASALCLKAGNAAILRAGSDSLQSAIALHTVFEAALEKNGLPKGAIALIKTKNRAAVGEMLKGLNGNIDVIVPRGGKSLVARVEQEARVPVFAHLEGICHIYVHEDADIDMTVNVITNAKMRRTGICGAVETLLFHKNTVQTHAPKVFEALKELGCEIRADNTLRAQDPTLSVATEQDWITEYLDAIVSAKTVANLDEAIEHINTLGSHHTDAIITENAQMAEIFLNTVDSALVMHNASTQFADGGQLGFGAEIGIATGRIHARGPVGLEQLTTFKYKIRGTGQTRPK